jgi:hypothetical protein
MYMIRLKQLLQEWTGDDWGSCAHWNETGAAYWDGEQDPTTKRRRPEITITKSTAEFKLEYKGPASGWAIAHKYKGVNDTLHQMFNVLVCECNPYLADGGLKPDINNIVVTSSVVNKFSYTMTITVPFISESDTAKIWQIDRRGSMGGGDPGENIILKSTKNKPNLEGPVRIQVKPGSIIEYVVCYTLPAA